jgi:hypothetical protein
LFFLATEIQNIQIGDGDVARNIAIPIWMLFPRTFTCPTLLTTNFKIGMLIDMKRRILIFFVLEFEISIVLVFNDDRMISESKIIICFSSSSN